MSPSGWCLCADSLGSATLGISRDSLVRGQEVRHERDLVHRIDLDIARMHRAGVVVAVVAASAVAARCAVVGSAAKACSHDDDEDDSRADSRCASALASNWSQQARHVQRTNEQVELHVLPPHLLLELGRALLELRRLALQDLCS